MTKTDTIVNVLCDFIAYVDSFYNEKSGLYPIKGMTNSMVIKGVQSYIAQIGDSESLEWGGGCLLDTSPSPRDLSTSRMPSSA